MAMESLKTIIIDNYDSYTFNLLQLWDTKDLHNVVVIRNDQFEWEYFQEHVLPYFDNIIISPGPGRPENPKDLGLVGPLLEFQRRELAHDRVALPMFGICLGFQAIGWTFGAKVSHAARVVHGRLSLINILEDARTRNGDSPYGDILDDIPTNIWATRYHSLVVDPKSLPECLQVTATCWEDDADILALRNTPPRLDKALSDSNENSLRNDSVHMKPPTNHQYTEGCEASLPYTTLMAFRHKVHPIYGVQFHPESICTEYGRKMIDNFHNITEQWKRNVQYQSFAHQLPEHISQLSVVSLTGLNPSSSLPPPPQDFNTNYALVAEKIWNGSDGSLDTQSLFKMLQQQPGASQSIAFLDSARQSSPYCHYSFLSVNNAFTMTYSTLHHETRISSPDNNSKSRSTSIYTLPPQQKILSYVSSFLQHFTHVPVQGIKSLPRNLNFRGGFIGYIGYEMKRETLEGYITPIKQRCACTEHETETISPSSLGCCQCTLEPDLALHFVDKFLAINVKEGSIYAICIVNQDQQRQNLLDDRADVLVGHTLEHAQGWLQSLKRNMYSISKAKISKSLSPPKILCKKDAWHHNEMATAEEALETSNRFSPSQIFTPDVDRSQYIPAIEEAIRLIGEGETYEVCLTTHFRRNFGVLSPTSLIELYFSHLRRRNPSPFSAFLSFPATGLTVLSSSPERFMRVNAQGIVEMKPIKGTTARVRDCCCSEHVAGERECKRLRQQRDKARAQDLWSDVKERGENLMIVDLVRNDLAHVCIPNTVTVPKLMHVESYETVHQLVSTVRGKQRSDADPIQTLAGCFPPGSMTGAPKLRTVEILDELEGHINRGVYSGCVGYFSIGTADNERGQCTSDFSVVIRTAVVNARKEVSIGAGGAITFLSKPDAEWNEVVLKTESVVPSPSVRSFIASNRSKSAPSSPLL
ncbi:hypothetical protein BZG36_04055 [Bifiguratus adelaidae]|uniref:aminodeoxychorismate synthase n=1 Tax=Bifiguratus adelaidae TaxID=1938954 RepID=A0A261XWE7_9FUNG|nr:hypothetical protein BZG36_04055 [Bifiguratus adelaidae]